MVTRIGSFAQNQLLLQSMLRTQAGVADLQVQVSSGKKTQSFSGLQGDALPLLNAKADLAKTNQFLENITIAEQRLDLMLLSVETIDNAAREMRSLFQNSQNGNAANVIDLPGIAAQFRDQIVDALNAQDSERFLFAGAKTDVRPVDLGNGVYTAPAPPPYDAVADTGYYEGDATVHSVRVDNNFEVQYGVLASADAFERVIRALDNVAQTTFTDPPTAAEIQVITDAIADLNAVIEDNGVNPTLEEIAAEIALDQNLIAAQRSKHDSVRVFLEDKIGDIENVDTSEAIANLNFQQVQLEASFQVISRAQQLSLNNFL